MDKCKQIYEFVNLNEPFILNNVRTVPYDNLKYYEKNHLKKELFLWEVYVLKELVSELDYFKFFYVNKDKSSIYLP